MGEETMFISGELLLVGTIFGIAFLLILTMAILSSGEMIERHPKAVPGAAPWWSSPVPATRIFAIGCWVLFVFGCDAAWFAESTLGHVLGIAAMFAALLIASTVMVMCAAVISVMNKKGCECNGKSQL